ncbi:MAG: MBL fold metallo-hydrolase, partial [Gammaproteobacteria bacterium]|nr:MBL fold metallo-hydrolase [Gammaproteobacteria bacterium]
MKLLAAHVAVIFGVMACQSNPYYNPGKPHHTPDGFRNNHPHMERQSFLKWRWQRM